METKPVPTTNPAIENETQRKEQFERFKEESFARFEALTGFTFDRATGDCTTPGKVRMDGEIRERWMGLCTRFSEEQDTAKAEEFLQEAGALLREAAGRPELKNEHTDT
jgi:hypothetical protein